jgi:predicted RNA-binding protein associated with RNAse of E/G family
LKTVQIHYHRPLRGTAVFRQTLVHRDATCAVTYMEHALLTQPVLAGDRVILEPGAPVVWFTFDGAWHDIGRFHTVDGTFTGCYANVLTPVRYHSPYEWETTDLCLDVWLGTDGARMVLDEHELSAAVDAGAITPELAQAALVEARRLLDAAAAATWPPPVVDEWPLERARGAV